MQIPTYERAKSQWKVSFRKSLIIYLSSILLVALTFVNSCATDVQGPEFQELIQIEEVEITQQQLEKEPPPRRLEIAEVIEVENDEVDPAITIANNPALDDPLPPRVENDFKTVQFYSLEKMPKVLRQVTPVYPELARKGGVEGKVMVEVVIGLDGKVESAVIVAEDPPGFFGEAALEAANQWEFSPAFQRDKPVKVIYNIPFKFALR